MALESAIAAMRGKDRCAKLIVLTDLHMTPAGCSIIGIDPYVRLRAAIEHINAHHADAQAAIVLGDLAHGGDAASYRRVRELTDALMPPVHFLLGNHDHRASFFDIFFASGGARSEFVQSELRIAGHRLLLLDTRLDEHRDGVDAAAGHLCRARLSWLEQRLIAAGADPVVLFMHHPPMAAGFPGMDKVRLLNDDELLGLIKRTGNVRHIVAGHIHRTISGAWHGIPFAIFKSPVHQQPLDFISASSSLSIDEPGAYGVILLSGTGLIVHTEDYDLATRCRPETP